MKNFFKIFVLVVLIFGVIGVGGYFGFRYFENDDVGEEYQVDFSELTYSALGDSITEAMDGTKGGALMSDPYCEIVKDTLGLKSVSNYGISGSTVCSAVGKDYAKLPMCERYLTMGKADIISVMGGTNDWGRYSTLGNINDTSADTFYGALNILAKGLKDNCQNSFIFFMTPLKCIQYEGRYEGAEFDAFRKAIKDVCAKYDIPVLDTAKLADTSKEFKSSGYNGDGLHPSQEFHKNTLAPVIVEFIKDNYKTK